MSSAPPRSETREAETPRTYNAQRGTERESFHSGPSLPASSRPKLHQFQPVPIASPARHPPPPTAVNCLPRFNATPYRSSSDHPSNRPFSRYPPIAHFLLKLGTLLGPASKQTILLCNQQTSNQSPPWSHHLLSLLVLRTSSCRSNAISLWCLNPILSPQHHKTPT